MACGASGIPARFLNRIDEIILFHRLKRADMGAIVDIQMATLAKLLAGTEDRGESLTRRGTGWPKKDMIQPMARGR